MGQQDVCGTTTIRTAAETAALGTGQRDAGVTSSTVTRTAAISAAYTSDSDGATMRQRGYLPHWERPGGIYFVTFRLADALPHHVLESLEDDVRLREIQDAQPASRASRQQPQPRLLVIQRIQRYLDTSTGACHLMRPEIAQIVASALQHFDGERYRLFCWCVMPNHVHVVFRPLSQYTLASILHSWKSFTAKAAQEILHSRGQFWQREYYDHLVRDEQDFRRIVEYVMNNPQKANLQNWRWVKMYENP